MLDQPEVGNWWHWEIGSPQALVNACAVLGSQVPASDLAGYMSTVGFFDPTPNGTGANLPMIVKQVGTGLVPDLEQY